MLPGSVGSASEWSGNGIARLWRGSWTLLVPLPDYDFAEAAKSMTVRGVSPEKIGLAAQQQLRSLQSAVGWSSP